MVKLSKKRLDKLAAVSANGGLWINTSWSDWPDGEKPMWIRDQFGVARELIRLARIGLDAERAAMSASQ